VLLWTRVSGSNDDRVPVRWAVARDPGMREIVAAGETTTGPERDYTVKVTASGLRPGMTCHYRFEALGERSPVGRTRTLPHDPEHVRLASVSWARWAMVQLRGTRTSPSSGRMRPRRRRKRLVFPTPFRPTTPTL